MLLLSNLTGDKSQQLVNLRMNNVASLSGSLTSSNKGLLEFVTTNNEPYFYDGSAWQKFRSIASAADLPLTNTYIYVGDGSNQAVATAKSSVAISDWGAATADVSIGSHKLTNVSTPTADTDGANKSYVDTVAQGLSAKTSCAIATFSVLPSSPTYSDAAGTLTAGSNGAITNTGIDSGASGVTIAVGTRILVKNQSTAYQNGVYEITQIGDASHPYILTRVADADTFSELDAAFVFIEEGTYADTGWVQTSDSFTIGTGTPTGSISWTQFSGAGSISAGNGIVLSGSTIHFQSSFGYSTGNLFYAQNSSAIGALAIGTSNRFLYSGGSAPAWSSWALPSPSATLTANQLLYSSSTTQVSTLTSAASSILVTNGSSVPSWATSIPTAVTIGGSYIYRAGGTDIALADGGTAASLTAVAGGVVYSGASALAISAAGTSSRHLLSGGTGAPTWSSWALPSTITTSSILYATSTTAMAALATANSSVLTTNGSGVPSWTAYNSARGSIGIARKWSQKVNGDGVNSFITVNHGLGSTDVIVGVRQSSSTDTLPLEIGLVKTEVVDSNNIKIYFTATQTATDYYVVSVVA